jgi:hypothetical protein
MLLIHSQLYCNVDAGSGEAGAGGNFNITNMEGYNVGVESRHEQQKQHCQGTKPNGVPDKGEIMSEVMESRCA